MNYTQSFEEFSKGLSGTDLALYAGIGIVLWVLFKDKLSPIQKIVLDFINQFKKPKTSATNIDVTSIFTSKPTVQEEDLFFQLVSSWKQTRDLAVKSNCSEAVKVADEMFPYLSPQACGGDKS